MGAIRLYDLQPVCHEEGEGYAGVRGDLVIMSELSSLEGGPLVRIHSACRYSEVLGSEDCDCAVQLKEAMASIALEGEGILFYLEQEGRGAGLAAKARGYAVSQAQSIDTVQAYEHLKIPFDSRQYGHCARFLLNNGIRSVRLMSNNPRKINALTDYGIHVTRRDHIVGVTRQNIDYLSTKRDRAGHLLPSDLRF